MQRRATKIELDFTKRMPHVKFTSISVEFGEREEIGATLDKLLGAAGFTVSPPAPAPKLIESSPQDAPPEPARTPRASPARKIAVPPAATQATHKSLAGWCRDALRDGPKTSAAIRAWIEARGKSIYAPQVYGVLFALTKRGELRQDDQERYSLT